MMLTDEIRETHAEVIARAADAVEAYYDWQRETYGPLRSFQGRFDRLRAEMKALTPEGKDLRDPALRATLSALREREKTIQAERREYIERHPQPRTADAILEDYAGGTGRLWKQLCDQVSEEMIRRREQRAQLEAAWPS